MKASHHDPTPALSSFTLMSSFSSVIAVRRNTARLIDNCHILQLRLFSILTATAAFFNDWPH